jgi:hypothetical protein
MYVLFFSGVIGMIKRVGWFGVQRGRVSGQGAKRCDREGDSLLPDAAAKASLNEPGLQVHIFWSTIFRRRRELKKQPGSPQDPGLST